MTTIALAIDHQHIAGTQKAHGVVEQGAVSRRQRQGHGDPGYPHRVELAADLGVDKALFAEVADGGGLALEQALMAGGVQRGGQVGDGVHSVFPYIRLGSQVISPGTQYSISMPNRKHSTIGQAAA